MVVYNKTYKKTADELAKKKRKKGLIATVKKKDKGYGVYVNRK